MFMSLNDHQNRPMINYVKYRSSKTLMKTMKKKYLYLLITSFTLGVITIVFYEHYILSIVANAKKDFPRETYFSKELDKRKDYFFQYPYSGTYDDIPCYYLYVNKPFQGESSIYSIVAYGKFKYEKAYTSAVNALTYEDTFIKPDSVTKKLMEKYN